MSGALAVETVEIPDPNGWERTLEMYIDRTPTEDGAGEVVSICFGRTLDVSIDQAERVIVVLQQMVAQARLMEV